MTVGRALTPRDRLMVTLDHATVETAADLVRSLGDSVGFYRIGLDQVLSGGLILAERLVAEGRRVLLDVKLLDIDSTVGKAVESIIRVGVRLATVHAHPKTMRAAVAARAHAALGLLGVTVSSFVDPADFAAAGYAGGIANRAVAEARDAAAAGMDGVLVSATEIEAIRAAVRDELAIVVPGIQIATAADAVRRGADYVVVGSPILEAADPMAAASTIIGEIAAGLEARAA